MLTFNQKTLIYEAVINRIMTIEKLLKSWRSEAENKLTADLIEMYSNDLKELEILKEKIYED